jgi:hypothetical protein
MEHEANHQITFVVPRPLLDRLRVSAKRHRRSRVGEFVWAVEQ